jgi:hypothetical protein
LSKRSEGRLCGRSFIRSEAQSPVKAQPGLVDLHASFEGEHGDRVSRAAVNR